MRTVLNIPHSEPDYTVLNLLQNFNHVIMKKSWLMVGRLIHSRTCIPGVNHELVDFVGHAVL